ncbi:MAG: serine hydrolase [Planctomycetaceae bacterium]
MRMVLIAVLTSVVALPAKAQQPSVHATRIAALVEPYLKHPRVNAVSVGVISGDTQWNSHYGLLDGAKSSPPGDKTIYEIGSISKVFTSLLVAEAVESGRLKLDDPISTIMTELATENPDVGRITFRQLSHHVSGLPMTPTNLKPADPTNPFADYDQDQLNEYLLTAKPERKPDVAYEYSNLGVGLLGDLLARQAGISYEELLRQKVTEPLKMSDTGTRLSDKQNTRVAPPHNAALLPDGRWDFGALAGCGGICSTVDDMLLFAKAWLNPPKTSLGKAMELAWKQHRPAQGAERAMGLGWMIAGDGSTRWHNGVTGGYQSMLLISRELNSATILLCNTAGSETDALGEQIFQTVVGMDVKPRTFEKPFDVDAKTVQRLAGRYQLTPGFVMTVQATDVRLQVQLTGQQFLPIFPTSRTEWKYKAVDATLHFELPETGNCPKVTLHQNGAQLPFVRIKE